MSRSQLTCKENKKDVMAHATTTTHLPNLHNMSTASLLSHCYLDKKQNSMTSNRSNYGSQVNFKLSSKTPTNLFIEKTSSSKKTPETPLTDEDKLRIFHEKMDYYNSELARKTNGDQDVSRLDGLTQVKFNNSIDTTYFDPRGLEKNNSFAYNESSHRSQLVMTKAIDVLTVPEYADDIFFHEKLKDKIWLPKSDYMTFQSDINEKMRRILIDWLLKVHSKFKLLPETIYLTVNIIDRYLSEEVITRKILQLIGVTAMHIA